MRGFLDASYRLAGIAAAASLFIIFTLVLVQVGARLLDGLMRLAGLTPFGFIVPSIAEISGFLLAAASFLALAHTLTVGGHIRVGLLVDRLPARVRRFTETLVGTTAAALAGYFGYAVGELALKSLRFNDVSFGFVAVPLWIPQAVMAFGLFLLAVALADVTWRAWRDGKFVDAPGEA